MKITVRLVVMLTTVITLVVTGFTWMQARNERHRLQDDLERRALLIGESLGDSLLTVRLSQQKQILNRSIQRLSGREKVLGAALYDTNGQLVALTQGIEDDWSRNWPGVQETLSFSNPRNYSFLLNGHPALVTTTALEQEGETAGVLAVVQSAGHIRTRIQAIWKEGFQRLLIQALLIVLATLVVIRWNIMLPLSSAAEWMKNMRLGKHMPPSTPLSPELFGPLAREVNRIAASLTQARAAAEEEAKLRLTAEAQWTPERLREFLKSKLNERTLFVIANREPYMHIRKGRQVEWLMPASGLVTGLEPVLRASGGMWIAHGSGDADRETVGPGDKIRVPPDDPQYTLRRIWLSKEEEDGHYYGFSNEGLWPLCHIAHARPQFNPDDWKHYRAVNQKFADAALKEMEGVEEPVVLVQDYHFALVPRMIKEKRPDARVALFWHIPWPNPESFGICPWRRELLNGMLGADLLGFHIQYHCNNFLDTVDRTLESRIDWERFSVYRQHHSTSVKPFPISVDFPSTIVDKTPRPDKANLLKELGVKAKWLGVGVDRLDYTKGIVERFRAIERMLEKYPEYAGQFTFVELGAPSRTLIQRYHDLTAEIEAEAQRINWRFQQRDWKPIVLLKKHHSHAAIRPFYQAADLCLVTSLHDGMNLVAKEFVAARDDEDGVLVLSAFAGASRELRDALIINPYDMDQTAEAIRLGLEMGIPEQAERMRRLRQTVRDNNIYRWAGSLVSELLEVPIHKTQVGVT